MGNNSTRVVELAREREIEKNTQVVFSSSSAAAATKSKLVSELGQ